MLVRAIQTGFYNSLRQPDDEFEVPDGAKASWFVPVGVLPSAGKKGKKPTDEQEGEGLV